MGKDLYKYRFYKAVFIIYDEASILFQLYGQACFEKAMTFKAVVCKPELIRMGDSRV